MKPAASQYALALKLAAPIGGEKQAVTALVSLLRRRGQMKLLPEILSELERRTKVEAGLREVAVTSAEPLSRGAKTAIERKARMLFPEAKRLEVTYHLDPGVIGGFRIDAPEARFDATVHKTLAEFSRNLRA